MIVFPCLPVLHIVLVGVKILCKDHIAEHRLRDSIARLESIKPWSQTCGEQVISPSWRGIAEEKQWLGGSKPSWYFCSCGYRWSLCGQPFCLSQPGPTVSCDDP